jgi:hypothetical protein
MTERVMKPIQPYVITEEGRTKLEEMMAYLFGHTQYKTYANGVKFSNGLLDTTGTIITWWEMIFKWIPLQIASAEAEALDITEKINHHLIFGDEDIIDVLHEEFLDVHGAAIIMAAEKETAKDEALKKEKEIKEKERLAALAGISEGYIKGREESKPEPEDDTYKPAWGGFSV